MIVIQSPRQMERQSGEIRKWCQALALLFREKDVKIGIYFGVFLIFIELQVFPSELEIRQSCLSLAVTLLPS